MGLIARLPQLHTIDVTVPDAEAAGGNFLLPLTDAPALTDLTICRECSWAAVDSALLAAIGGCAALCRLSLHRLNLLSDTIISLCSLPTLSRLQHLELVECHVSTAWAGTAGPPSADEYRAGLGALEQLQSLSLSVNVVRALLPHLHRAPSLRLLSIRCPASGFTHGAALSSLPDPDVLHALVIAAPQLQVQVQVPIGIQRWLTFLASAVGDLSPRPQGWRELLAVAAEMDRVTIVDVNPCFF
jgi:hypothetical protein